MRFLCVAAFVSGASCLYAQLPGPTVPITGKERLGWVVNGTLGGRSLAVGVLSSGLGAWRNSPVEQGPHWDGFAKRYGIRLSGIAVDRTIEASVGALWGEDPRYRALGEGQPTRARLMHVVKWTFVTANRDGGVHPAYARYVGLGSGSFLSSAWRPDSDADVKSSVQRIYLGVLLKMTSNAVAEFGLYHRHRPVPGATTPVTP